MRTVAIVQARMGSSRFPGKTLADLAGAPLLLRVLMRVAAATSVDAVVVATTQEPGDDAVASCATDAGFPVFRGSTDDVLDRYVRAAREHDAGIIVRNTADEPFVDPALIDEAVSVFASSSPDYVSNNLEHVYPEGLDTEVVSMKALSVAHAEATRPSDREHVTPFIWRQPSRFRLAPVHREPKRPELRLTVDYPADLEFANALYAALPSGFGLDEVIALLDDRPDLLAMCPVVPRREGYLKSVSDE